MEKGTFMWMQWPSTVWCAAAHTVNLVSIDCLTACSPPSASFHFLWPILHACLIWLTPPHMTSTASLIINQSKLKCWLAARTQKNLNVPDENSSRSFPLLDTETSCAAVPLWGTFRVMYTLSLLHIWLQLNLNCYTGHVSVLRLCSEVFSRLALEQASCELQRAAAPTSVLIPSAVWESVSRWINNGNKNDRTPKRKAYFLYLCK